MKLKEVILIIKTDFLWNLFSSLLFFLPLTILAQNEMNKKVYLDSLWRRSSKWQILSNNWIVWFNYELYNIKDFYKSGKVANGRISKLKMAIQRGGSCVSLRKW
jgi:hypothetical protein